MGVGTGGDGQVRQVKQLPEIFWGSGTFISIVIHYWLDRGEKGGSSPPTRVGVNIIGSSQTCTTIMLQKHARMIAGHGHRRHRG